MTMDGIVCADDDMCHTVGHRDAREAAGEGLLVHMRMRKDTGCKNDAVIAQHIPPIGIMVPPFVRMGNRDVEAIGATCFQPDIHSLDIGFTRKNR